MAADEKGCKESMFTTHVCACWMCLVMFDHVMDSKQNFMAPSHPSSSSLIKCIRERRQPGSGHSPVTMRREIAPDVATLSCALPASLFPVLLLLLLLLPGSSTAAAAAVALGGVAESAARPANLGGIAPLHPLPTAAVPATRPAFHSALHR